MFKKTASATKPLERVYSGNIFDRMSGLEMLFNDCHGASVLDLGCAEGLIGYEFARHGARVIHGFEIDQRRVEFATMLFQSVPVESQFRYANIAVDFQRFATQFSDMLRQRYDIVLYLGVYHHLVKQTSVSTVHEFIEALLDKTNRYFAARTNNLGEFEPLVLSKGFTVCAEKPSSDVLGQLKIYSRR